MTEVVSDPEMEYILDERDYPSQFLIKGKFMARTQQETLQYSYVQFCMGLPIIDYVLFNIYMKPKDLAKTKPECHSFKVLQRLENKDTFYFLFEIKMNGYLFSKGTQYLVLSALRKLPNGIYIEVQKSIDVPGFKRDPKFELAEIKQSVQLYEPLYGSDGSYQGFLSKHCSVSAPRISASFNMLKPFLIRSTKRNYLSVNKVLSRKLAKNKRGYLKMGGN